MTDFNKLADAIDPAKLTPDSDDTALRREAARILRAACAADVGGLMRQAQVFADAYTEWANYPTNRLEAQHDAARAALESALRVALAQRDGYVIDLLVAAGHVTAEKVAQARIAASQAGAAQEPKP